MQTGMTELSMKSFFKFSDLQQYLKTTIFNEDSRNISFIQDGNLVFIYFFVHISKCLSFERKIMKLSW